MKNHFLVEHALENVWAQPTQDKQHVIQMARYTPTSGVYQRARIQRFDVDLPAPTDGAMLWHHVFQIGSTFPSLLALNSLKNAWVRADTIGMNHGVMMNVFLESGAEIALCHCWLRQVSDSNILLAVEIRPEFNLGLHKIINDQNQEEIVQRQIADEKVYFRCYQNAKAQANAWALKTPSDFKPMSYVYQYIANSADFITFLNKVRATQTKHGSLGKGRYYIDGFLVGTQQAYRASSHLGRYLIYIHDETVLYEAIVKFEDMGTFISKVDAGTAKMLILADAAVKDASIHYHDDVDFYIANHSLVTQAEGKAVYFGRTRKDIVRQVTHNAYSLRTPSLNAVINEHSADFLNQGPVYIRYIIRDGGMRKGLPFQRDRLNDLYKLPVDRIKQALYGVNSVLPEWRAENLEASQYMKIVSADWNKIDDVMVSKGYGFHALQAVSFSEVLRPVNGIWSLKSGYLVSPTRNNVNASMHRYDRAGLYIGAKNVLLQNLQHFDNEPGITAAEFINMPMHETEDGTYLDQDVVSKDLVEYGFRAYVCSWRRGAPVNDWTDATGSVWYSYTVKDGVGTIAWNYSLLDAAGLYPAVRIQNKVHCYKYIPTGTYGGVIRFSIESSQSVAGKMVKQKQHIPSDTLDLFLNGVPLIENVDYYVKWPEVVIVKRNLAASDKTSVWVRHYGVSIGQTFDHRVPREVGFTKAGILSADEEYDLRNDRNIRIIVDGQLKTRSEVRFAEETTGPLSGDGRPFSIQEYRFPLDGFIPVSAKTLAVEAEQIDDRVTAYISPIINPKITGRAFIEGDRYQVVSPLISALLHAMRNFNFLNNGELNNKTITDKVIETLAAPYWSLLQYEPIYNGASVYFVNILPHQYAAQMEVTERQYVFLEHIIHIYLKDSIDLTPYVKIKTVTT